MRKCIVIPDSFKGTLQAKEICEIAEEKIREFYPDCEVDKIPVADGGEGTVDCFVKAIGAEKVSLLVHNAYMEQIPVCYAKKGRLAVIEMAQAAGLPLVQGRENPLLTTTYGVGEMILHAIENGCDDLIIGLGGSCTNDCGCGLAAALGVCFRKEDGTKFIPVGGSLNEISSIDMEKVQEKLRGIRVRAMCDVQNPLCGEHGAAFVFAPQKGADEGQVKLLDDNLRYIGEYLGRMFGYDVIHLPGAGAAGGMGAGIEVFLGGELISGIDLVLDLVDFEARLAHTDLVITGEGRFDSQSLKGKAVIGISKRAVKKNVPVIAVTGSIGEGAQKAYEMGVTALFSINRQAQDFQVSKHFSRENFAATLEDILRLYRAAEGCKMIWNEKITCQKF